MNPKEELFGLVKKNFEKFGEPTIVAAPIRWKFLVLEMLQGSKVKPVFLPGNVITNVLYIEWSWLSKMQIPLDGIDVFP
jgi:hypothetical protein